MDSKRIAEILKDDYAIRASIQPLKDKEEEISKGEGWAIIGLDTEFNIRDQYTISYQLYFDEEHNEIIEGPNQLSLREIADRSYRLSGGAYQRVCIPAFFNTAELSQLAIPFWKEKDVRFYKVHPSGLFHIEGESEKFHFLFYDLWHFFASYENSSLHRVAADFGFQKLEYEVSDLSLANLSDPAFRAYAINDARLCVQIFKKLDETYRQINGISILARPTPANAAQASFKLNYLKKEVKAPHRFVRRLAMRANWAGRVECGFVGANDSVHEHDADSLYPRSTLLLPNLPAATDWQLRIPSYFDGIEGFVEAEFEFPKDEEWPCLPVFEQKRLLFPLSGYTSCTIGELRAAISRGLRYSIKSCVFYTAGEHDEYHRFIEDNIALKEQNEGNKAIRSVAKLNMNSSIGKFIQNKGGMDYEQAAKFIQQHKDIEDWMVPLIYANLLRSYDLDFNESVRLGSSFYPEWHTLILGKAREVMAWAIYNAISYPKILMISTDSLHVRNPNLGRTEIRFNHKLGPAEFISIRSRLHLSRAEDGKILKVAHHGMPVNSQRAAEIILSAHGKDVIELERRGKLTLRESVLTGRPFGTDKIDPDYRVSLKPDSKRIIDDEGWTHPLRSAI